MSSDQVLRIWCHSVKVGSVVIINDFDRPSARLVAVVTDVDGDAIIARYLSNDPYLDSYVRKGMTGVVGEATPLGDFGVVLQLNADGNYWCEKQDVPIATYHDGSPRDWQDTFNPSPWNTGRTELVALIRETWVKIEVV